MLELALAGWLYVDACGFRADAESYPSGQGAVTKPAPNIRGYWIRKNSVVSIVNWRKSPGTQCTTLYVRGAPHAIHVIGTTEEILKKLWE